MGRGCKSFKFWDFLGDPAVKTASNAEDVGSLGRELRSHMLHCTAKKKTKPLKVHVTKSVDNLGETEKDVKDASVETSDGNDTHVPRC